MDSVGRTIADGSYWTVTSIGWPTDVTGLTSIDFEADGSYYLSGNFRRPGKADESYLTSVVADGS
jgi:hypothetical protein